jgi:hypothetical protein
MPFDGTELFENRPIAKLGAVERLLATEQQWCKGRLRDAYGRHCLVGAIEAVGARQILQKPVLHAAREVSGRRYWRIEFFNDDPRTTHADVLAVLRRTRENLIAGMISECGPQPWYRKWMRAVHSLSWRSTPDPAPAGGEYQPLPEMRAAAHPAEDRHRQPERAVVMELQ